MKKMVKRVLTVLKAAAGILAAGVAVFLIRKRTDANEKRKEARQEVEDRVRATHARHVAEQYEGVGEIIDAGRSRFAARAKDRVHSAGSGTSGE